MRWSIPRSRWCPWARWVGPAAVTATGPTPGGNGGTRLGSAPNRAPRCVLSLGILSGDRLLGVDPGVVTGGRASVRPAGRSVVLPGRVTAGLPALTFEGFLALTGTWDVGRRLALAHGPSFPDPQWV